MLFSNFGLVDGVVNAIQSGVITAKDTVYNSLTNALPSINIEGVPVTYLMVGTVLTVMGLTFAQQKIREMVEKHPEHKGKIGWAVTVGGMVIIYLVAFM